MVDIIGRAKIVVEGDLDPASMRDAGSRAGSFLTGALKKTAIGAAGAVGTAVGAAVFKGFQRLSSIENAEAKLKGLGNSAKTVAQVMEDALAAVKGTAFGLGDAASVAASAVASGVKPGQELERTLRLVADAATNAGIPLNEMGAIFNKVAATGKIQGEVIAQLGERGIPILQLLADQLGVTAAEVVELASTGQINFATFQKAIEEGMGGAALESGKTFEGALANAGAALGRFGAALLGPSFKDAPDVFQAITTKLDEAAPAAAEVGKKIGQLGDKIKEFQGTKEWKDFKGDMGRLGGDLLTIAGGFGKIMAQLDKLSKYTTGKGILTTFTIALVNLTEQFVPLSKIADAIEMIADAIERLDVTKIPDIFSGSGGGLLGGLFPFLASGGPASGLTVVGERGPELVDLPTGSYVHSAANTQQMLAGAGGDSVVVNHNYFGPVTGNEQKREQEWFMRFGLRFGSQTGLSPSVVNS